MKLLSPEVICEDTRATDAQELRTGHWAISASASGTTSFSGSFGCEPRVSASASDFWEHDVGASITYYNSKFERVHTHSASNVQTGKLSRWLSWDANVIFSSMTPEASPPLSKAELYDIGIAIGEIDSGKAKHFRNLRDAFDWLDSDTE